MNVDIFIVTHAKDSEWVHYCLLSIDKFAKGFERVLLMVPLQDYELFNPMQKLHSKVKVIPFYQAPPPLGHLHHCVIKCSADQFGGFTDYFLFMDSDCIFREPATPEDYFIGGKPVLLCESYESLQLRNAGETCWKEGTSRTLGFVPTHECMRRHPAVHYGFILKKFREHVEVLHGVEFLAYALSQKPDHPVGFNDFNNLGAFVRRFHSDRYHLIDLTNHPERRPRDKLIQYWSHGGLDNPQERWLDGRSERIVPREEIKKVLL